MADNDFEIVSVEPSEPPTNTSGTGWHCYIIEQGANRIRGYKRGSINSVTRDVEDIVESLNRRRYGSNGRVHLTELSYRKKPVDEH